MREGERRLASANGFPAKRPASAGHRLGAVDQIEWDGIDRRNLHAGHGRQPVIEWRGAVLIAISRVTLNKLARMFLDYNRPVVGKMLQECLKDQS